MGIGIAKKRAIKALVKRKLLSKIEDTELKGMAKPFHEKLFSKERIRTASFLHSCSGAIGKALFESIAKIIATGNFIEVEREFHVQGVLSSKAQVTIENIIEDLGRKSRDPKKRYPNIVQEAKEILAASRGEGVERDQITDLFLKTTDGKEIYIQLKTSKPNKGESEETKRQMLKVIGLRNKQVTTFVGMNYNPYEPEEYNWTIPLNYLKIGQDLLIGKDFWDFLGGNGTYEELLNLFEEVGKDLKPRIENRFEQDSKKRNLTNFI